MEKNQRLFGKRTQNKDEKLEQYCLQTHDGKRSRSLQTQMLKTYQHSMRNAHKEELQKLMER